MRNPYINTSATEINLRDELHNMFHGNGYEIKKSHRGLLRRMRRDSNNLLISCSCKSSLTDEADRDVDCPFCLGEGYYWDEEWINLRWVDIGGTLTKMTYKTMPFSPGALDVDTKVFFLEYFVNPSYYDRIIELKSDAEGDLIQPFTRYRIFKPQSVIPYRSDNGRIEFTAVFCSQKDAIFTEESFAK